MDITTKLLMSIDIKILNLVTYIVSFIFLLLSTLIYHEDPYCCKLSEANRGWPIRFVQAPIKEQQTEENVKIMCDCYEGLSDKIGQIINIGKIKISDQLTIYILRTFLTYGFYYSFANSLTFIVLKLQGKIK